MSILFVDQPQARKRLHPLTFTRPVAHLRVGILTLAEKWIRYLQVDEFGFFTEAYLQAKFQRITPGNDSYWVVDGILPTVPLVEKVKALKPGEALYQGKQLLVARGAENPTEADYLKIEFSDQSTQTITRTWDIFRLNGQEIRADYELITKGRSPRKIEDPYTITYGENIFLEEGVKVKAAILNAENGPIYIGKNAEIQEGAMIRGPFALGESSVVSMGTKVRGDSSTGPYCKIGGEISNSVLWGYSNKAHDGFLGNSVIGQWCNLGAGTNNSNLKNNYDPVSMWDYEHETFMKTNMQFCGLIMGDHSKSAINTMFNTGTTVGVAVNTFGEGFPRSMIPSFSWGGASGFVTHHIRKALITAKIVMQRRNIELYEPDKAILNHIFDSTARSRVWENE